MFNRLFGRRGEPAPASILPAVRNVTIGRTVMVDMLAWKRFGDDARLPLERDTLEIVAQGLVELDDGGFVHRFYTDDHVMFQLVTTDRAGSQINDISLFAPWDSAYPASRAEREAWLRRMSAPTFEAAGLPVFERLWFGPGEGMQAPVTFWEDLHDDRDGKVDRRIFQACMLYQRELGPPGEGAGRELLLAIEQEEDGQPVSHEIMVGVPLEMGEFRVYNGRFRKPETQMFPHDDFLGNALAFLVAFLIAGLFTIAFKVIYQAITPYKESRLIREGNASAAIVLGGALLGYVIPLASALANTATLVEFCAWAALAGVIQIVSFTVIRFTVMKDLAVRVERGEIAPALYLLSISLAVGTLNAACMTA